ncbi:hypothetical protein DMUE_1507 [Dictyocoela muelleri]|nr:hypothetical protein DMUE_1507 [Dictyocoela muelleri]
MESSRRNLIIAICISAVMLLGIMVFIMYGSSIISEKNEQQIVMIKESKNLQLAKKIVDIGFNTLTGSGEHINCFLFANNDICFINKRIPDEEFIVKDRREIISLNYFLKSDLIYRIASKQGLISPNQKLEIKFNRINAENLIKDNSWSGSFYRLLGGQFIPDTVIDISNRLEQSGEIMAGRTIGVCLIDKVVYLFVKYGDYGNIEIINEIYGYNDKISPIEILFYVFKIEIAG